MKRQPVEQSGVCIDSLESLCERLEPFDLIPILRTRRTPIRVFWQNKSWHAGVLALNLYSIHETKDAWKMLDWIKENGLAVRKLMVRVKLPIKEKP